MRRLLTLVFIALVLLLAAGVTAAPATAAVWVWPVSGEVITPYRNGSDPYATGRHRGIDIAAAVGTAVRAAAAGEVRFAGTAGSSGLTISIRTGDGYDTSYLHLSALDVRAGVRVSAGDRIGAVGTSGSRSAAAPHLHFGVRDAGTRHAYHDPLAFLPPAPPATPAPEPTPAPAPQPSPSPPAPVPVPVGAPGPARAPGPERSPHARPRPHHLPHRRPAGHPARGPLRTPQPAGLRSIPSAQPLVADRAGLPQGASPVADRAGLPQGASPRVAPLPKRAGGLGQAPPVAGLGKATGQTLPPARSAKGIERAAAGPDIGWVLACAGLLLAAAVLGLTEDGRRAGTRTRSMLRAHFARARAARG